MLKGEGGKMGSVGSDVVEFVVGCHNRCEVEHSILEENLVSQLVDGLHVLLVED